MRLLWLVAPVLAVGCGDNHAAPDAHADTALPGTDAPGVDARPIDAPAIDAPIDANPLEPTTLAGTGLCVDAACATISADVHEYAPQFTLFSDGATKRRWIRLPPGTQIDTTDMDHWDFPVGTQLWKEFTDEHGVRIETRYLAKVSTSTQEPWFMVSYAWNATQDAAVAVPDGVTNANGTTHDIPDHSHCRQCHENLKPSRVLGFGAISLDFAQSNPNLLDLDRVIAAGMLTANPAGASSPHFPLPGTATDQAALGYLHANCGHCHNDTSSIFTNGQTGILQRLDTQHLDQVTNTPAYTTLVGKTGHTLFLSGAECPPPGPDNMGNCPPLTTLIAPGDSAHSIVFARMATPGLLGTNQHMPVIATKTIDPVGTAAVQTWIDGLH